MAFLFGSKKGRHPSELVKQTRESLAQLEKAKGNTKNAEKASEVISSNLVQMKVTFTTDPAADGSQEAANVLLTEILANDLILPLLNQLGELEFEAKKDTVSIFNHLLRKQSNGKHPAVEYICKNTAILDELVAGFVFFFWLQKKSCWMAKNSRESPLDVCSENWHGCGCKLLQPQFTNRLFLVLDMTSPKSR